MLLPIIVSIALISEMNFATGAGIMAAGALIATFWRSIVSGAKRVADLVICRVVFKDQAARAVMSYVWRSGKKSPFGLRLFGGITSYVFPKRRMEIVGYEGITSEPLLFWYGRVPLLVGSGQNNGNESTPNAGIQESNTLPVTLRFIRRTLDIDVFMESALRTYNDLRKARSEVEHTGTFRRFNVLRMHGSSGHSYPSAPSRSQGSEKAVSDDSSSFLTQIQRNELRLLTWQPDDLIERSNDALPFANHPVSPELLSEFDEISLWLQEEKWFRSKGIPWRRGYLITGRPGSGKDTLVRNLAMRHDLPIYAFDLSSYENREFTDDWKQVMQNAPAIALCSDLDACFRGRENIIVKDKQRTGLTFDCFLNTISGVGSNEGVLLFITTNHPESLDPALGVSTNGHGSTRPGRVDKIIHMGPMGVNERRKLAHIILEEWPDQVETIVRDGEGQMAAQFQEQCAQLALLLWKQKHKISA